MGDVDNQEIENFIKKLGLENMKIKGVSLTSKRNKLDKSKKKKKVSQLGGDAKAGDGTFTAKLKAKKGVKEKKTQQQQPIQQASVINQKLVVENPVQDEEISSSSALPSRCIIQLTGKWFEFELTAGSEMKEPSDDTTVSRYADLAKKLYEKEVSIYEKECLREEKSHAEWMKTVVSSGVLADKVAALGMQIQEAPVHTLQYLEQLLAMGKKKGRREAGLAVDALKHLFLEDLLPKQRKLRRFEKHGFDELVSMSKTDRNRRLLLWYYEGQLKNKYEDFVNIQQNLAVDTLAAVKIQAITTMYELLVNRPELEQKILSLLVNKLGDPDYKVATRVVHWLKSLVKNHPRMNAVVVREVKQLLYRPNTSKKTQYHSICFLNQLLMSAREDELATNLIAIYFKFFNLSLQKKKRTEDNQKMLSALLTGVNRAYPFSRVDDEKVNEQMDLLFKVAQQSTFNTGLQALMLLKQVLASRHSMTDRFYSALYRKLLDPGLATSHRQAMFLNLIFQATKDDEDLKRVRAFIKRTLQVCHGQSPPFICGALFMISEVVRNKPNLKLFDVIEEDDSDEEETFKDVKSEDEGNQTESKPERQGTSSWVHKQPMVKCKSKVYDAFARNPVFSGSEKAIPWELMKLAGHFHPSVSQFAEKILTGETIMYDGNPLDDFTIMKFLNRFVYKNPKSRSETAAAPFEKKAAVSIDQAPVNSSKLLTLPQDSIPMDVQFFHKYFSEKKELAEKKKEQARERRLEEGEVGSDDDSGASSVADEEFEEFMEEELDNLMEEVDSDDAAGESNDDEDEDKVIDDFKNFANEDDLEDGLDFARTCCRPPFLQQRPQYKESKEEEGAADGSSSDEESEDDSVLSEDDFDQSDVDEGGDREKGTFAVVKGNNEDEPEFDEEGFAESDDEEAKALPPPKKKTKTNPNIDKGGNKKKGGQKKRKKKTTTTTVGEDPELQDNADKFSSLIDENVSAKFDHMTMEALSNKDNANRKQLKWEMDRHKWIKGRDTKSIIAAKKSGNKRHRWFSKKGKGGKPKGNKK
ncbi:hypothetical protein BSL78_00727 [Apostichopus japonicus]|uniref:CCAAT/enhancer-binding protein zeta n=1 Tax=Stichopus japonicus TaxID=307972 RepID=A0A2G8LPV8_STIJA|nr:hypothetical protein BSL78_00727 [Apostichopus japonicus]